jgi:hypothetical protein
LILRFFHLCGARDWQPHKSVLSAKAEGPVKTRQVFDPVRSGW